MIPSIQFVKSRFKTSRLGFGTSRLHFLSSACRQRLLAGAVDHGLTHIDTAPVYGDGLAEREVGRFVAGRRSTVVIATKFGIAANPLIDRFPALAPALRPMRAVGRRAGFWKMQHVPLTGEGLTRSVESSLRRLNTDAIDILLLHEPDDRIASTDALFAAVSDLRCRGLIRLFGLSGSWYNILRVEAAFRASVDVLQTAESEWTCDRPPDITYGALTGTPQNAFVAKTGTGKVTERLVAALTRRAHGTVLVSTTSIDHLRDLVRVTECV